MRHLSHCAILFLVASSACSSGSGASSTQTDSVADTATSVETSSALDSASAEVRTDSSADIRGDSSTPTTTQDALSPETTTDVAATDTALDTANYDTTVVDSVAADIAQDSGIRETSTGDSLVADTSLDTAVHDTAAIDSSATDSAIADSGADTSVQDTRPEVAADAGTVTGPCDIFATGNTPCVAAFSTVRALLGAYTGSLYQVTRASDNTTKDIGVLSPGGIANAAMQDTFCSGTSCTISILYDQSGKGNHLTRAPLNQQQYHNGGQDVLAVANALPITINGKKAYGIHSPPGTGYRNDATKGVATGDQPEVIYEVTDGTYTVDGCCFDFGNAETNNKAGANGSMEALFFGTGYWDKGNGAGPWVLADLEDGVYNEGGASGATNGNEPSMPYHFVTGMIKGNSSNATAGNGPFAIKGANAQSGTLATWYNGARPTGYSPMQKQGAILLGIGGDDSNAGGGNFYEGVMTSGYSSDATDNAVQANIVAAGYGK